MTGGEYLIKRISELEFNMALLIDKLRETEKERDALKKPPEPPPENTDA